MPGVYEDRGTFAPNTGRRPGVPACHVRMQNVKEAIQHCWSPAETRGILARNTGRRPGVPRCCNRRNVRAKFHHCLPTAETRTFAPCHLDGKEELCAAIDW
jgi:hypothetical protein